MNVVAWIQEAWREITLLELLILSVIVGIIVAVVFGAHERQSAESRCFDAGYTQAKRVRGGTYCVRQRNGTDEVIRLDEVPLR